MADKIVGGDGDWVRLPNEHFWMLADAPDRYVATAIWEIEQHYNPERSEEDIQWYAPVEEGTE